MPDLLIREKGFDAACFLIGRIGRTFGFRLNHPIIIIGTGRCGTQLLVKLLNSHPGISGFPGEANELWHPKLEPFESSVIDIPPIEIDPMRFSEISVANWPHKYGDRIRDTFTGFNLITGPSKVFFTKSAMISFMMPKILEIFPEARFIHIYRYGPSVIESYFKKNFGKDSRYVFAEKDYRIYCAKYWNACILEIENRKRELSLDNKGQIIEFSYEHLCQNPREILEKISRFLGVKSNGFRFDLSRISSQNDKAAESVKKPEYTELLEVMSPGMKLKNYSCESVNIMI
jgi:hypothetical protein